MTDVTTADRRDPAAPGRTGASVHDLYAEQRLAEMTGLDAWLYRRYRRLPPRGRMFVGETLFWLVFWLAIYGVLDLLSGERRHSLLPIAAALIGVAVGSRVRRVPFRYR